MNFIDKFFVKKNNLQTEAVKVMNSPKRDNHIDGFIGAKKCGKSSTMRSRAEVWRKTHDSSFKIYGYDPQNVFGKKNNVDGSTSIQLIEKSNTIDPENKEWATELLTLRNCLVILDEIRILIPHKAHPPKGFLNFLSQSSFNNVDIMYSLHNPSQLPTICADFTNFYFIFITYSKEGSFETSIPNSYKCNIGARAVNDYVMNNGRGKHRLDGEYCGQGFPYIVFDVEKQTLKSVNFNKNKIK